MLFTDQGCRRRDGQPGDPAAGRGCRCAAGGGVQVTRNPLRAGAADSGSGASNWSAPANRLCRLLAAVLVVAATEDDAGRGVENQWVQPRLAVEVEHVLERTGDPVEGGGIVDEAE